jgi:hypothetical protein
MTESDLSNIETNLKVRLPAAYREAVINTNAALPLQMFIDAQTIIGTNLGYRRISWLGRPLDGVFFVFGRDDKGNALFMDLDMPGGLVMSADHARHRGRAEARSFKEWFAKVRQRKRPMPNAERPTPNG